MIIQGRFDRVLEIIAFPSFRS